MWAEQISSEAPRTSETVSVPIEINNTPEILKELQTMETLQPVLRDISSVLNDKKYTPLLKTEFKLQLDSVQMKEKINTLLETGDLDNLQALLENTVTDVKNKQLKEDVKVKQEDVKVKQEDVKVKQEDVKVKQEDVKVKQEDVKVKQEDVKVKQEDRISIKKDDEEAIEITKATFELANKRIEAMYDAFGWPDEFKKTFPENEQWSKDAQKKIQKDKPNLDKNSDEFKTQVQLQVFLDNRQAIEQKVPPGSNLSAIYQDLENSAIALDLRIPVPNINWPKIPNTPGNDEKAKISFSKEEQSNLSRRGNTLESASSDGTKKVMDMKTGQVYMESANGIRIHSKQEYHSSYEIEARIQTLNTELATIENRSLWLKTYLNSLPATFAFPKITTLWVDSFWTFKQRFEKDSKDPQANVEDREKAKSMLAEITEMETEFKEDEKRKETIFLTLTALEKAKTTHVERYRQSIESETEAARANLDFLQDTHLTSLFGDSGVKLLIEQINDTTPNKFTSLTLQEKWGPKEKELFANGVKRLLGIEWAEAKDFFDGYTMKSFAPDMTTPIETSLKKKLELSGVYGGIPPKIIPENVKKVMSGVRAE